MTGRHDGGPGVDLPGSPGDADHRPQAAGARTFGASAAYESFMGRYSTPLAPAFVDAVGLTPGVSALDVGCGPGALTSVLVERLGTPAVGALDPSPPFVAACATRCPGVDVRLGQAEAIPFGTDSFDAALAQLVLHFVSDPDAAAEELRRVVRPGGLVAACVWDFEGGMAMLRHFWEAASAVDPGAPDEARVLRFGRSGEIADLWRSHGFEAVSESIIEVTVAYGGFDDLWSGFLAGIGPAGSYCASLDDDRQALVREELRRRVGSPTGPFELGAVARAAVGQVPAKA